MKQPQMLPQWILCPAVKADPDSAWPACRQGSPAVGCMPLLCHFGATSKLMIPTDGISNAARCQDIGKATKLRSCRNHHRLSACMPCAQSCCLSSHHQSYSNMPNISSMELGF